MKKGMFSVLMTRLRAWLAGPRESESWNRASLCSMAPLSADAFRHNEEAEHSMGHWY